MASSVVHYIVIGDLTLGVWCPYCFLPSGYSAPMWWLSDAGVAPFGTLRRCMDCDSPLTDDT